MGSAAAAALFAYPDVHTVGADTVAARLSPSLNIERHWWKQGSHRVAGVDEVGRGALAGPLVAAAVILPPCGRRGFPMLTGVTDSKLLTQVEREHWSECIRAEAVGIGIGIVESAELDDVGLGAANRLAMERAVLELSITPDVVLLDAVVTELPLPQVGLIDGDATCMSIAAASIIAKVTRDRLMVELDRVEDRYGFAAHKGYGTASHLAALNMYGPCPAHRRCFSPVGALCQRG